MAVTEQALLAALSSVLDPHTGKDYVSTRALRNLQVTGADVAFDVEMGYPAQSLVPALRGQFVAAAKTVEGVGNVSVNITSKVAAHAVQRGVQLLPGVKNIIAISSGKGGVGKSTTTANLALALAAEGARVGILDADIYGPSQPMMMGISGRPESPDGKTMEPMESHGVQVMSIGFLVNNDQAMIWRGPMATQALEQMLRQTNWKDLDYLLVDMPPGTGDIQLTLAQRVPMTGAVVVTTPQDIALIDAKKGVKMFEKVGVPILGLVGVVGDGLLSRALDRVLGARGDLLVRRGGVLGVPEQLLAGGRRLRISTGLAAAEAPLRRVPGSSLQLVATTVERVLHQRTTRTGRPSAAVRSRASIRPSMHDMFALLTTPLAGSTSPAVAIDTEGQAVAATPSAKIATKPAQSVAGVRVLRRHMIRASASNAARSMNEPPTSAHSRFGSPISDPKCALATVPAAGPENTIRNGCSIARCDGTSVAAQSAKLSRPVNPRSARPFSRAAV